MPFITIDLDITASLPMTAGRPQSGSLRSFFGCRENGSAISPNIHNFRFKFQLKNLNRRLAKERGASLNGYTKQALKAKIKADMGKDIKIPNQH